MSKWKFHEEKPRVGAESALDACDYFGDEVIEPWKVQGMKYFEYFNFLGVSFDSFSNINSMHNIYKLI
jgi:hypothetical protein